MDSTAFRLRKAEAARAFPLATTFVHLKDLGQAASVPAEPGFWSSVDTRSDLQVGRLVWTRRLEQDVAEWELHPAGDELLVALSGDFEVVLQDGRADRVIALPAGSAFLVPFGVWHRVMVKTPGEVLFVTAAKGTQKRSA